MDRASMRRCAYSLLAVLLALALLVPSPARATGIESGYLVQDLAGALTAEEREAREERARELSSAGVAGLLVLVPPDDPDVDIEALVDEAIAASAAQEDAFLFLSGSCEVRAVGNPTLVWPDDRHFDAVLRALHDVQEASGTLAAIDYFLDAFGALVVGQEMPLPDGWTPSGDPDDADATEGGAPVATPEAPTGTSIPRLYDRAEVFTSAEAQEIQRLCDDYSWRYHIDVAVLTGTGNTVDNLKYFTDRFYDEYRAAGASTNALVLTNDPEIRQLRIDVFGEIIPLLPHEVRAPVQDRMAACWKEERYLDGVKAFLDGLAGPLAQRAEDIEAAARLEVPDAVPGQRIYDPAGLLTAEQVAQLEDAATLPSDFVDFVVVTCADGNDALTGLLAESMGGAYASATGATNVIVLALDGDGRAALWGAGEGATFLDQAVSTLASQGMPLTEEFEPNNTMQLYLAHAAADRAPFDAARFCLDEIEMACAWRAEFDAVPETVVETAYLIRDESGMLSAEEIASLEQRAQRLYDERRMRMAVLLVDDERSWIVDERYQRTSFAAQEALGDDRFLLVASPHSAYVRLDTNGSVALRKVSYSHERQVRSVIGERLAAGQVYDACMGFLNDMEAPMAALLPDYSMAENALAYLLSAAFIGAVGGLLTLLVLWLMSRGRRPKAPPTRTYVVPGSFVVGFSQDAFISSHTTRTARPQESESSGGGGGGGSSSSDGPRSSGSQTGY